MKRLIANKIQLLPKFALANLIKWMALFSILNQAIEFEGESAQTYSNVGAQRRVLKNSFASFKSENSTKQTTWSRLNNFHIRNFIKVIIGDFLTINLNYNRLKPRAFAP